MKIVLAFLFLICTTQAFSYTIEGFDHTVWSKSGVDDQNVRISFASIGVATLEINGFSFTSDTIKLTNYTEENTGIVRDALFFYQNGYFVGLLYIENENCLIIPDENAPEDCITKN